ncbi:hypothetical protein AAJ76_6600013598 [Vairimorpha ceranae]|uniref:Uncharacterized protein n=1 Tax=Vairimorpha ceranae TaxID=40302 RepID=A0A0F9YP89_9MICR|nr:hypothetical protein AAJ76_6600013598 [Vairimorpha ceranae]KKO74487.1 hypothetical protein AAJ76_6600013598 [Vairimorpha ceranae]
MTGGTPSAIPSGDNNPTPTTETPESSPASNPPQEEAALLTNDLKFNNLLKFDSLKKNMWVGLDGLNQRLGWKNKKEQVGEKEPEEKIGKKSTPGVKGEFGDPVSIKETPSKNKGNESGDVSNSFNKAFTNPEKPKEEKFEPIKFTPAKLQIKPNELNNGKDYSKIVNIETEEPEDYKLKKIADEKQMKEVLGVNDLDLPKKDLKPKKMLTTENIISVNKTTLPSDYLGTDKTLSEEDENDSIGNIVEKSKKREKFVPKIGLKEGSRKDIKKLKHHKKDHHKSHHKSQLKKSSHLKKQGLKHQNMDLHTLLNNTKEVV